MSAEPGRDRVKKPVTDPAPRGFVITEESRPDEGAQVRALARLIREAETKR